MAWFAVHFQKMVADAEDDWMLHGYDRLAAAGVSSEDAIKEMEEFYQQIDSVEDTSAPPTPKMVDEEDFTVVVSSDEEEKADESDDNDFVVDDE